ncbi:MAG TPA: asparagine synthase-related protein [Methylomirabilota bacterium]|jgi:asparagine synthase (glutamine-hydrolysing)|nr:asparagine synthase-related protein [Methylomirabilota bacterium]
MTGVWVIRWDTAEEATPRVLNAAGGEYLGACRFDAPSGLLVVFDGYLFDRSDLELGPPGSDASLVAAAYERWKDGIVEKIAGGFALGLWDSERKRLVVARDAMGLHPCYYRWDGRLFLASPVLDAILAQPEVAGFDRVVLAEYLQSAVSSHQVGETFYEGIRRLPSAHVLSLHDGRLALARYWDPVPPGFSWAGDDEISRFPPTLSRAVGRCLAAGADSIALSGGFDSVSIATLAAEQLRGRPPLHAVSLRFADTVCDEGATQLEVARSLGMPQIMRTIADSLEGESAVDAALALSEWSPSPVLSPWQSMYSGLLRGAGESGLSRLLLGTGGDDMFAVDLSYGADRLAALDLGGLWRFCRAIQRTSPFPPLRVARMVLWGGALAPGLRQLVRAALDPVAPRATDWLRDRRRRRSVSPWSVPSDREIRNVIDQRAVSAPVPDMAPGEGSYVRAIRRLTQSPVLMLEQEQGYAWARRHGFTLLFPYFDRDVVELSLRTRPEHLIAGGRAKTPLRRLVAERLPSVDMPAKKVDFTLTAQDIVRPGAEQAWRRLGGPEMLNGLGLVDADRLNRMMRDYFAGRSVSLSDVWSVLSTEMWLRVRSTAVVHGPTTRGALA